MYIQKSDAVGLIVARNVQAASVFNYYGIDFYSKGERTLEHACLEDNAAMPTILEELWELKHQKANVPDFSNMNLTDLSVYILKTHHKFTEKRIVFIRHTLDRLARENGHSSNNIHRIRRTFEDLSVYLTVHMKHEEFIIFPFIQNVSKAGRAKVLKMGNLQHPIAAMKNDHNHEVSTLKSLAKMTNNYHVPVHSDYALSMTYGAMKELEEDLKIHMHLENNILFPKALGLAELSNQTMN